ncbi:glutaconate CoA-transferase subunit B [Natronorubrum sediminis]|uniref:Glutaconate CoA-transferase subunit B n=1 Tax=Natronorubrum sediminis TaxID=640943 RepID=A0A1H6FRI2_9EURY|nr:CoA-transferase [Natronorubrum sediminis]SEH13487.1 glutaconate CoA-transferase subunit B [Natronorubrum sediminis]
MTDVVDLSRLVARVEDGSTIAFGGKTLHRAPMAFVRELVRADVSDLVPIGLANSMDIDLLAGTGQLEAACYGYVGFEAFGLAPNTRRAIEDGTLEAREGTCYTVATALRAAMQGVPFLPIAGLDGSDLLEIGDDYLAEATDPFTGESTYAVRRVEPDIAVIHATEVDTDGNARFDGADLTENLVAKAADRVFVTAERVVDADAFTDDPGSTDVPGVLVDAVAEVPDGAHPCSCPGSYDYDREHLEQYLEAASSGDLEAYLSKYVGPDEDHYRDRAVADRREVLEWSARQSAVSSDGGVDDGGSIEAESRTTDSSGAVTSETASSNAASSDHRHDPEPAIDCTIAEVMTVAIARRLEEISVAFQGFASPLPTVALRAARERAGTTHLSASGAMNGSPAETPLSTEDARLLEGAPAHFSSPEAFDLAARGGVDVMFVGGAQVDRRGRLNNTVAGSWADPTVKFGGGGGAGSLLPLVEEAWAWRTEHRARSLPAEVDFTTAEGNLTYLVTPLCEFERRDGELQVVSIHPGVSREEIRERTGWDVRFASSEVDETPLPTDEELEALERVDPTRVRRSGFETLSALE